MTGREMCEALLSVYQEQYPTIGLTFGYIGNCGPGFGDTTYDDRSWYFFTDVQQPADSLGGGREKFGGVRTQNLLRLSMNAGVKLGQFCERVAAAKCKRDNGCSFCDYDERRGHCHTLS